jgi:hypothetical protein
VGQIRLIAITLGLTVLIWVFADQLLQDTDELLIRIVPVQGTGADVLVRPAAATAAPYHVRVSGSRKVIAKKVPGRVYTVELPITEDAPGQFETPGEYTLNNLAERLQSLGDPPLTNLVVESVEPQDLRVIVDREVKVSMPVRIVDAGSFDFAFEPTVEPAEVWVTISEIALRGLGDERPGITQDQRFVGLSVTRYLSKFPKGDLFSRPVMLEPRVAGVEVRLEPAEVRLVAKLHERRTEATVPAVPIVFHASQAVFNRYLIDRRDNYTVLTQPVVIRGPEDAVKSILDGQTRIFGTVFLSTPEADDVGEFRLVTPEFSLPPGVTLAEQPAPVEFRLVPTKSAATAEGA